MTDNEIIKALECCINDEVGITQCAVCPYHEIGDGDYCVQDLLQQSLDLINRQKAEIERLQKEQDHFADIGKMYSEIKAEAVKEVIERLKPWYKFLCVDRGDWYDQLEAFEHNLVKEMAGDTE